jgi:hypothetical protein
MNAGAKSLRAQLGLPDNESNAEEGDDDGDTNGYDDSQRNKNDERITHTQQGDSITASKNRPDNDCNDDDDAYESYSGPGCSPAVSELLRLPALQKAIRGDEVPSEQEIDDIVKKFVAERIADDPKANSYMLPDSAHMRLHLPAFMDLSKSACEQRIETLRAWLDALDDDAVSAREKMRSVLQQPQFLKVLLELCRHTQGGVAPLAAEVMGRLCAWYCEFFLCVCVCV